MNAERLAEIQRDLERGGDGDQWPAAAVRELVTEVERLQAEEAIAWQKGYEQGFRDRGRV